MYVILFTPQQGREYGSPEAVGPFVDEVAAQEHLDENVTVEDGWEATVLAVSDPSEER